MKNVKIKVETIEKYTDQRGKPKKHIKYRICNEKKMQDNKRAVEFGSVHLMNGNRHLRITKIEDGIAICSVRESEWWWS